MTVSVPDKNMYIDSLTQTAKNRYNVSIKTSHVKSYPAEREEMCIRDRDWSDRDGFEASYRPKKVLSGTGAGDTTIAAFLTAMLEGYPFEMCIRLAAAEGASCVEALSLIHI